MNFLRTIVVVSMAVVLASSSPIPRAPKNPEEGDLFEGDIAGVVRDTRAFRYN